MGRPVLLNAGDKFARLTVLAYAGVNKKGQGQHRCVCDCGRERVVITTALKRGYVTSCGHIDCGNFRRVDLTGQRFGRLTVKRECRDVNGKWSWECLCDCGNARIARNGRLRGGHITSCGCAAASPAERDAVGTKFGRLTLVKAGVGRNHDGSVLSEFSCDCGGYVVCPHHSVRSGARTKCGKKDCRPEAFRLDGKRFGSLVVIGVSPSTSRKDDKRCNTIWDCVCDCGNNCRIQTSYLTKGKRTSCGRGTCHWAWRGGAGTTGSEAWARARLARIGIASRRGGYAEPYEGWERVIELWMECDGVCACCKRKRRGLLVLDHCHETGRLRGFLCGGCNTSIGLIGESPSALVAAAKYVAIQCAQKQLVLA